MNMIELRQHAWLKMTAAIALTMTLAALLAGSVRADEPAAPPVIDIGSRRELFVDKFLVERLDNATLKLHEPAKMPRPQSPLIGAYVTVIKDGDRFVLRTDGFASVHVGADPGELLTRPLRFTGKELVQRYADSIATVVEAGPGVSIVEGGRSRPARPGDRLDSGESISVNNDATARVQLAGVGSAMLGPSTIRRRL